MTEAAGLSFIFSLLFLRFGGTRPCTESDFLTCSSDQDKKQIFVQGMRSKPWFEGPFMAVGVGIRTCPGSHEEGQTSAPSEDPTKELKIHGKSAAILAH